MRALLSQALLGSATVVALQVLLPRLFSVLLWYHLGFLAVSLAMAGFALGGAVVRRRVEISGLRGGGLDRELLLSMAGLATVSALALAFRLPLEASELLFEPVDAVLLVVLVLAVSLPFVLLGTAVCASLDLGRDALGRVYGATFLGGAAGAALCLGAMELLGARRAAGFVAMLPCLAALGRPRVPTLAALGAAALLLASPDTLLPRSSAKHFPRVPAERILLEQSDAVSDVVFYENPEHHGLWMDASSGVPVPETVGAAIDAWAITFITRRSGPDDFPALLDRHPAGLAYAGARPGFTALVIGAGGGWDVLGALRAGASHVTAVELNPILVDAVRGRWAEYSGHLYDDPRVTPVVAEGRAFVERDEQRYDRIVLAGVDTFAATQAGAFALAENHLYTAEALDAWLEHLEPGGMLFLTRWWFEPPRQTLRLLLTASDALERDGAPDPRRRMFAAQGGNSLVVLKKGDDFTEGEFETLIGEARQRGATPLYAWGRPSHPVLVEALDTRDRQAWIDAYPYRVEPSTDDRPFFFEYGRTTSLFRSQGDWIHDRLGGREVLAVTLVALLLLVTPLLAGARSRAFGGMGRALPFLALGAAYLFVEVPTMQRLTLLLGHPVHAVAVVLVALLVWSGLGSLLAERMPSRAAGPMALACGALVVLTLLVAHGPVVDALHGRAFGLRAAGVAAWLAPAGLAMGTCFPLALRRMSHERRHLLPSAFLWNGVASVLAAPVAVLLAMDHGFTTVLAVGAAAYLLAGALLLPAPWRTSA